MKWQVLMVGLATVLAVFLGAERWHARITAHSAFSKNAAQGHWVLIYGDQEGVKALRENGSPERLHGFEKLPPYNTGGFDVTSDLARLAYVDMSDYSNPQLRVVNARHVERPLVVASAAPGHQLQCPLFDVDGSVLYLETGTSRAWEMHRLAVPASSSAKSSLPPTAVSWPSPLDPNDCPERSTDGSVFAWMGTDAQIHIARRDPSGNFAPEAKVPGVDFELASDGSFVASFDGTNLVATDTTSLARHTIARNVRGSRIIAITPDGTWVAASTTGSYGTGGWTAFRVRDGAEVPLSVAANSYYFGYDTRRKIWLAK